jgi:peroxiredoxin
MTVVDVLGRVDELADGTGGSVNAAEIEHDEAREQMGMRSSRWADHLVGGRLLPRCPRTCAYSVK